MATIECPIHEAAKISTDQAALIYGESVLLYPDLDHTVTATVERLRDAGCATGQRVAIFLRDDARTVLALLSLMRLGAVAVPISTRMPGPAVKSMLHKASCEKLLISRQQTKVETLADVDVLDVDDLLSFNLSAKLRKEDERIPLNRDATIIFTSGSTGSPKAILHTYGSHYYSALGANVNMRLRSGDRWLLSLPLHHVSGIGIVFRCILAGAGIVVPEADWDLDTMIDEQNVTHMSMVPTQLHRYMQNEGAIQRLKKLKGILLGGGPIPASLIEKARTAGLHVHTTYGLTEMASQVCTTAFETPPDRKATAGRVLRHREVSLSGDGEIRVRGATLFKGYVDGQEVQLPLDSEGWFLTGDCGAMDGEGYLTVQGRVDNMFVSGGENIYPEEVEKALLSLAEVEEAVVVPIPDKEFGHRPVAFVRWSQDGNEIDADELARALSTTLPGYKRPVAYYTWPDDGEERSMKPDRSRFQAEAERLARA